MIIVETIKNVKECSMSFVETKHFIENIISKFHSIPGEIRNKVKNKITREYNKSHENNMLYYKFPKLC